MNGWVNELMNRWMDGLIIDRNFENRTEIPSKMTHPSAYCLWGNRQLEQNVTNH